MIWVLRWVMTSFLLLVGSTVVRVSRKWAFWFSLAINVPALTTNLLSLLVQLFAVAILLHKQSRAFYGFSTRPCKSQSNKTMHIAYLILCLASANWLVGCAMSDEKKSEVVYLELAILRDAVEQYRSDIGYYPQSRENLDVLYSNSGTDNWRGPYTRVRPIDPWLRPYRCRKVGDSVILFSSGFDGIVDTDDDIIESSKGIGGTQ
jgi:hypothetical protein